MTIEIERKFLVDGDGWRDGVTGSRRIRQAYLSKGGAASVRIRLVDEREARLTVKAAGSVDGAALARAEFEYPVPFEHAQAMLDLRIGRIIEKTRYLVPAGNGRVWEVDVFDGDHEGLILAEIELDAADEHVVLPDWIGREVTDDPGYSNAVLAQVG
ncbi:CYTH domain-containing protein [Novosphingobium mangrovi (ex Huang et al. 2023)]|uniref:CYTH domain-containing protein n=1 Tax=Novosphingobium mangrovi (ex Huang et al. 2023) TaxID=2976432 RepID=A0ABT2I2M3_9SPHN|nr:CYTH domain-containing protein [Novosphingobium mangrovi (ex Huang et al. 2023)]MCT2399053.1 CYTH domain-containing protein [Novosphingobium mangrovi (ex Huang et al. 2023)]